MIMCKLLGVAELKARDRQNGNGAMLMIWFGAVRQAPETFASWVVESGASEARKRTIFHPAEVMAETSLRPRLGDHAARASFPKGIAN